MYCMCSRAFLAQNVQNVHGDLRSEPLAVLGHLRPCDIAIVVVVEALEELLHLFNVGEVLTTKATLKLLYQNNVRCLFLSFLHSK
jgi:hypothetical protein